MLGAGACVRVCMHEEHVCMRVRMHRGRASMHDKGGACGKGGAWQRGVCAWWGGGRAWHKGKNASERYASYWNVVLLNIFSCSQNYLVKIKDHLVV